MESPFRDSFVIIIQGSLAPATAGSFRCSTHRTATAFLFLSVEPHGRLLALTNRNRLCLSRNGLEELSGLPGVLPFGRQRTDRRNVIGAERQSGNPKSVVA